MSRYISDRKTLEQGLQFNEIIIKKSASWIEALFGKLAS